MLFILAEVFIISPEGCIHKGPFIVLKRENSYNLCLKACGLLKTLSFLLQSCVLIVWAYVWWFARNANCWKMAHLYRARFLVIESLLEQGALCIGWHLRLQEQSDYWHFLTAHSFSILPLFHCIFSLLWICWTDIFQRWTGHWRAGLLMIEFNIETEV